MPTPGERHREGNTAPRRCYLRARGGCFGSLESDHVIEKRWLVEEWRRKRTARRLGRIADHPLLHVDVDDLIADPRNAGWLCGAHNGGKFVAMIGVAPHEIPATVRDFAAEYELEALVERLERR